MIRTRLAMIAAVVCAAAVLGIGYIAGSVTGLVYVAAGVTVAALLVARLTLRYRFSPPLVKNKSPHQRRPALSAADFPDYTKIIAEVTWAQLSRRDHDHGLGPLLARLGSALGGPAGLTDVGRPARNPERGVELATLERIVAKLEEL